VGYKAEMKVSAIINANREAGTRLVGAREWLSCSCRFPLLSKMKLGRRSTEWTGSDIVPLPMRLLSGSTCLYTLCREAILSAEQQQPAGDSGF
jgi:hypothetical protein